jgi:hypothetical protein
LSDPYPIIKQSNKKKRKGQKMYKVNLETFNGTVKTINLPSKGAVAQFISTYPTQLPVGVSVKVACDALGVRGTLRGVAK